MGSGERLEDLGAALGEYKPLSSPIVRVGVTVEQPNLRCPVDQFDSGVMTELQPLG